MVLKVNYYCQGETTCFQPTRYLVLADPAQQIRSVRMHNGGDAFDTLCLMDVATGRPIYSQRGVLVGADVQIFEPLCD